MQLGLMSRAQPLEAQWDSVQYFCDRYKTPFTRVSILIHVHCMKSFAAEELCNYQTLSDFEIGQGA